MSFIGSENGPLCQQPQPLMLKERVLIDEESQATTMGLREFAALRRRVGRFGRRSSFCGSDARRSVGQRVVDLALRGEDGGESGQTKC